MKKFLGNVLNTLSVRKKEHKDRKEDSGKKSKSNKEDFTPIGLTADDFIEENCPRIDFSSVQHIEILKQSINTHLPSGQRAKIWRYLSNYIPIDPEKEQFALNKKRSEYQYLMSQYEIEKYESSNDTHSLEIFRLIQKDVDRTLTEWKIFKHSQIKKSMQRVLFIHSLRSAKQKSDERL